MTPEAGPEVATHTEHLVTPVLRHHNILSIHPPVPVSEGEVVPAVFTIDVGDKIHLAIPLGAFALSLLRGHGRPGRTDGAVPGHWSGCTRRLESTHGDPCHRRGRGATSGELSPGQPADEGTSLRRTFYRVQISSSISRLAVILVAHPPLSRTRCRISSEAVP
jgi:hypothetical protein